MGAYLIGLQNYILWSKYLIKTHKSRDELIIGLRKKSDF
jgi:hypothetical protein